MTLEVVNVVPETLMKALTDKLDISE